MCGPGTGIAPFRAFLEERKATSRQGQGLAVLWRGEREDLLLLQGRVRGLSGRWHADEAHHGLEPRSGGEDLCAASHARKRAELWQWLEQGAIFYVCGDASRMALDVDKALHTIIEQQGGKSPEEAVAYVQAIKEAKRYRRDVY
jgi:sulfite reductase (NADPH) flavoprotein alpha-component